jgi:ADP-ribosylglycohydrolase
MFSLGSAGVSEYLNPGHAPMNNNKPTSNQPRDRSDQIAGVVLGTAVGDALGLPREGISRNRGRKIFGRPPLRHRFVFGRGMMSDDTEHTCMVGQSLLRAPDNVDAFARSLAWRLRSLDASARATLGQTICWEGIRFTRPAAPHLASSDSQKPSFFADCAAAWLSTLVAALLKVIEKKRTRTALS